MEGIQLIKITVPQDEAYLVDEHVKMFADEELEIEEL